jgi:hypothetical protein
VVTDLILTHFQNNEDLIIFFFGRRVPGRFKRNSDLDVGFWNTDNQPIDLLSIGLLREILEDSIVPFKVDLVDFQNVSDSFTKSATSNSKLIKGSASQLISLVNAKLSVQ